MCLGLRVREVLALECSDFDFDPLRLLVAHKAVHSRIDMSRPNTARTSCRSVPRSQSFCWRGEAAAAERGLLGLP